MSLRREKIGFAFFLSGVDVMLLTLVVYVFFPLVQSWWGDAIIIPLLCGFGLIIVACILLEVWELARPPHVFED